MTRTPEVIAQRLDAVAALTGHRFADPELLCQALTHRSYANEAGVPDYERLEFLGDAVVNLLARRMLIERSTGDEGLLSHRQQHVVPTELLAKPGVSLGLPALIFLGKGESAKPRVEPKIVGDVVEALFGALYLEGGLEATTVFASRTLGPLVDRADEGPAENAVSRLQNLTQDRWKVLPAYAFARVGEDHAPTFTATVSVRGERITEGTGRSQKEARKNAAHLALTILERRLDDEATGASRVEPG